MPVINGRGVEPIPREQWPAIGEAMAIIDADLTHTGRAPCSHAPCTLWLTGQPPAVLAELREVAPSGLEMWSEGQVIGFVNVVGDTQEEAIRHLAAIIASVRIGGIKPCDQLVVA